MSQLEHRLSQEMHAMAERIVPGDLRPLRPPLPRAWSREALHRLAAITAIALVAVVIVTARYELARPPGSLPSALQPTADPGTVAVTSTSNVLRLLAVATGRVVRTVRVAAGSNGIALSPDSKSVFVAGPTLMLTQVVIATGKARHIGTGAYPSVSPNSKFLAYAAGTAFTTIAVRDLHTGLTKSINLYSLIGSGSSLLNRGGLTWLGDGTQIVAVSEPDAVPLAAVHAEVMPVKATDCGQQTSTRGLCAIVIDVAFRYVSLTVRGPSSPAIAHAMFTGVWESPVLTLAAHRVYVPQVAAQQELDLISGDLADRHSVFVGQSSRSASVVTAVCFGGRRPATRTLAVLPPTSIPVAMAPDGDRLIYMPQGSRVTLWVATVHRARLQHPRLLMADSRSFELNEAAW